MDESLLYVTANRVGVFRRGKSKSKVVRAWTSYFLRLLLRAFRD